MAAILGLCIILLSQTASGASPGEVQDLEKRVLDYRRSLQRGYLKLSQKIYKGPEAALDHERVTQIWFEGNKIRNDTSVRYQKDAPFHREINCRNCERDGHGIHYSEQKLPGNPVIALKLQKVKDSSEFANFPVIDPRLLGMDLTISPGLAFSHMQAIIGRTAREKSTLRQATWKEKDCRVIEFKDLKGIIFQVWVVPEWGPSVVRIESVAEAGGNRHHEWVECDYKQVGAGKLWYPRSVEYQSLVDGKLMRKETVEVQEVSLNEKADPMALTLAGMNIPVGTPVSGTGRGLMTWNGKELVPRASAPRLPKGEKSEAEEASSLRRWVLLGISMSAAGTGGYLVWSCLFSAREQLEKPK